MRIAVCFFLAAVLAAGCGAPKKRHTKGPTAAARTSTSSSSTRTKRVQAPKSSTTTKRAPSPTTGSTRPAKPPESPAVIPPAQPTPEPPVASAGETTTPDAAAAPFDPKAYRLAAGDGVHIDVFNEPELTVNAGIDAAGTINYPLLGHIQAAGLTTRELEIKLTEQLKAGYLVNPSVRVGIHHFRPIFIMGMVRRVGSHKYSPGLTVEKALAMAGGITEYGSSKKIYVQHAGQTEDQKEKVNLDYPLRPGDTILVEERLF